MHWLTTTALKARLLIVSIAAVLLIIGIVQIRQAAVDIFPEFSSVYVEVQTEALGLAAEEVEQILTVALEQDLLNGIAFLDEIWSESMTGLSRVVCVFEPGTDPMKARQVVAERLTQAHALPNVSKPPVMLQPYSSTSRVLKIGLSPASEELSLVDLSVLARWTIQPYLMGVEGVANVSIWGQRKRQMQVQVNPENLKNKGVRLGEVIKTAGEALWVSPLTFLESSTPGTGGFFDTPNQRLGVRHVLPITKPEHLAAVPLHGHPNTLLGDVSQVVENHPPLIGDAIVNGRSGLMLVIEKFPWANTIDVTKNVETALAELKPGLNGIAFDTEIFRPANFAKASFANFSKALLIGLLLVVIALFFYHWRSALVSSISILFSLLAAAYVLHLYGTTFNIMVLGGLMLALVIILYNSVLIVENIQRKLDQPRQLIGSQSNKASLIIEAVSEMQSPLFYAVFAIFLAFLPCYFTENLTGSFIGPLTSSFAVAVVVSLLVAFCLIPALSMLLLPQTSMEDRRPAAPSSLPHRWADSSAKWMERPVLAYALFGLLALASIGLYLNSDKNFSAPDLQMRDLVIQLDAEEGTSLPQMNQLTKAAIDDLSQLSGVRNVAAHIGRAVMSDKIKNVNSAEIWLNIDEEANYSATLMAIRKALEGHAALSPSVQTYYQQSIHKPLRLSDHPYTMRVYGEDQTLLSQKAEEVKEAISNIQGISKPRVDYPPMESIIVVETNLDAARQHQIKPGDVRRAASVLVSGVEVGSLFEGQKVFDVVVWGTPDIRDNIEDISNLLVDKPGGGQVRLGEVANVKTVKAPRVIRRESVSQYLDVPFDYHGNNHLTLTDDINQQLSKLDFPLEYHAELTGTFQQLQASKSQLYQLIFAVLIGLLLLFQAAFMSWRLALVFLAGLPVALSGGLVVSAILGSGLSMGVLAGLLAVLVMAILTGIRLIKHLKQLEVIEGIAFGRELIRQGMKECASPIVLTLLITALLFLPFAVLGNGPGLELLRPTALVLLGGLATTLLFQLYILPALFLQFGRSSESAIAEEKAMLELDREVRPVAIETAH